MDDRLVARINIRFYSDSEASVEYATSVTSKEQIEHDLIQAMAFYYAKILCNLGHCKHADSLVNHVNIVVTRLLVESIEGKAGSFGPLKSNAKLVEPRAKGTKKTYSGELYERSNKSKFIQTHNSPFGEGHYAPMSVIMLLTYCTYTLSQQGIGVMILSLIAMNKYYREEANYYDAKSMVYAPYWALNSVVRLLTRDDSRTWDEPNTGLRSASEILDAYCKWNEAKDASSWLDKGVRLGLLGSQEGALKCYEKALVLDLNNEYLWRCKGNSLISLGDIDEGLKCLDKSLELNPKNVESWDNKGNILYNLGRYYDAIQCYDRVLDLDPNNAAAWHSKGNSLCFLGNLIEGIECFDKALELGLSDPQLYRDRAEAIRRLKIDVS